MRRLALLFAATVAMPAGLAAQETRQLDAHAHGESTLNVAIEGTAVAMELAAPATDIVGFEHEPSNDEQRAAIEAATKALSTPLDVFVFPEGASCEVSSVSVKQRFEDDHSAEEAQDEAHEGEATHSEFHAVYELACANPSAIDAVDFAFFNLFPLAEAVAVQIITEHGQAAFEVERAAPRLKLEGVLG